MGGGFADSYKLVGAADGCRENCDGTNIAFGFEFSDAFEDSGDAVALGIDEAAAEFCYAEFFLQDSSARKFKEVLLGCRA